MPGCFIAISLFTMVFASIIAIVVDIIIGLISDLIIQAILAGISGLAKSIDFSFDNMIDGFFDLLSIIGMDLSAFTFDWSAPDLTKNEMVILIAILASVAGIVVSLLTYKTARNLEFATRGDAESTSKLILALQDARLSGVKVGDKISNLLDELMDISKKGKSLENAQLNAYWAFIFGLFGLVLTVLGHLLFEDNMDAKLFILFFEAITMIPVLYFGLKGINNKINPIKWLSIFATGFALVNLGILIYEFSIVIPTYLEE